MYQDGLNDQINIAYQKTEIKNEDQVLVFDGKGSFIQKEEGQETFFTYGELKVHMDRVDESEFYYLFSVREERYYLFTGSIPEDFVKSYKAKPRRTIFNDHPDEYSYLVLTAAHVNDWYKNTKYCGACGSETLVRKDERAKTCTCCGNRMYPQINPAVIVGVSNGDKLLLTKYANRDHSRYALIAGFVEVGETLEMAVKREVMEEAGVQVKNIRYFDSQPWGITGGLLSGFFAELDGDETITMDEVELKEAAWIPREQVQEMDLTMRSLTSTMMDAWRQGVNKE